MRCELSMTHRFFLKVHLKGQMTSPPGGGKFFSKDLPPPGEKFFFDYFFGFDYEKGDFQVSQRRPRASGGPGDAFRQPGNVSGRLEDF